MAIVVSTNLVDSTRQQWLDDIIACKYVMNGTTYRERSRRSRLLEKLQDLILESRSGARRAGRIPSPK